MNITTPAFQKLTEIPVIRTLTAFAQENGVQLYLVGGCVRDLLLDRPTADFDFTLASDAIQFAKTFADSLGGTCIPLEEHPPTARVVLKKPSISLDFSQFRAASLTEDLQLRDLTINAMAVELKPASASQTFCLIDPCDGINDLDARRLQFLSEQVLLDDPLRLIRIYRFAAQLDFEITPDSVNLVQKYRQLLPRVSAERIRDELIKILNVQHATPYLQRMSTDGLLAHTVPTVTQTPMLWKPLETFEKSAIPAPLRFYQNEIDIYLNGTLGTETHRRAFIKLSLLLQGKLRDIGNQLRLSRKAVQFMKCLGSTHPLLTETQLTQKQINQFLRTAATEWWGGLLFSAALHPMDAAALRAVADTYYRHVLPTLKQGQLITGKELIQRFALKEGKQIGTLLKQIEERQFNGEIRTRAEALATAEALIRQ